LVANGIVATLATSGSSVVVVPGFTRGYSVEDAVLVVVANDNDKYEGQ
jgi:hypothetical protein